MGEHCERVLEDSPANVLSEPFTHHHDNQGHCFK